MRFREPEGASQMALTLCFREPVGASPMALTLAVSHQIRLVFLWVFVFESVSFLEIGRAHV